MGLLVVWCEFLCYGACVCGAALGLGVAFAFGLLLSGGFIGVCWLDLNAVNS